MDETCNITPKLGKIVNIVGDDRQQEVIWEMSDEKCWFSETETCTMRYRLLILTIVTALFAPLGSAATPATEPSSRPSAEPKPVEKDGVSVSVLLKQRTIPSGEQPKFAVRFSNTTKDYINLYNVGAFCDWHIQFTSTDKRAVHPGPWELRMDKIPNRLDVALEQIKAGESMEVAVDLNDPPFTFDFVHKGAQKKPVAPVRRLSPGTYRVIITIALQSPFGPGPHMWVGPLTTDAVELKVSEAAANAKESQPTAQEVADYDNAINQVVQKLEPGGLWENGSFPEIKLPADAKQEDVIAFAVNMHDLGSKAYRILRVKRLDRSRGDDMSAALVRVGTKPTVLIFYPIGKNGWWTRFYDTDLKPPATQPAKPPASMATSQLTEG